MLHDRKLWLLISLKLSGEATKEELEELEVYLNDHPELFTKVEALKKLWKTPDQASTDDAEISFEKHFQRLNSQLSNDAVLPSKKNKAGEMPAMNKIPGKKYYRLWWSVAAASVLLCWIFFRSSEEIRPKSVGNIVSTKPGYKASVDLPDGSKVWLNADSKLTYDGDFRGETREVYLSGEAFFDVAKDKERPFIIHTRTINLKVLGTAFNLRSYENDNETETALVHGSVEVTLRDNPDKKIVLKPGEKLLVKNSRVDTSVKYTKKNHDEEEPIAVLTNIHYYGTDSGIVETSWTRNQLVFDKENLEKIAAKIERWYNVKVIIQRENLKEGKYTATFEDENLEQVLEALKITGGFHYTIKNKQVIISR